MKRFQFLFISCLLTFICLTSEAQTTLEEYNYLTKGYKVQIESGLDMKKGYSILDVDKGEINNRTFALKALYRINGKLTEKAAYLIIYTRTGSTPEYICVPHVNSDSEVISRYYKQLNNGYSDNSIRLQIIALVLTSLISWS